MKQLTVAIPAYNAQKYLDKCLESLLWNGGDERLEVLVIDDGSIDRTGMIADQYAEKYPEQVRVIHKENGGHGSGINRAAEQAIGRYLKILDADDWIVKENVKPILDDLEQTQAEAVLTSFQTVDMRTGKRTPYQLELVQGKREVTLDEMMEEFHRVMRCCTFHGLMYRTDAYRASGVQMSEGIFYEDQEYATLPFSYVERVRLIPLYFYQYQLGNGEQSVAAENQIKRVGQLEQVLWKITAFYGAHPEMEQVRREYFLQKMTVVSMSYFATTLAKNPNRRQGRADAERVWERMKKEEPELALRVAGRYRMLRVANQLGVSRLFPAVYQKVRSTKGYQRLHNEWVRNSRHREQR